MPEISRAKKKSLPVLHFGARRQQPELLLLKQKSANS
jgi:hypothetical protein